MNDPPVDQPVDQRIQPADEPAQSVSGTSPEYIYRVRIINPKNKRDFMDLNWHNVRSRKFESVSDLKMKLIDSFPEYVGPAPHFQVGYLEGRGNQKRWVVRVEDLKAMYDAFFEGDTIKLWCDGKEKEDSRKRKNDDKVEESKSKKEKNDEIEANIRTQLEEKHSSDYSAPQYTLWAKLIRAGRHDSYDEPPPIPLITGKEKAHKKDNVSDIIVGAATAFAQALKTPSPSIASTPVTPTSTAASIQMGLSPNNQASVRRKCLEDLRMLSQLFNDGVLSESEYLEQKQAILTCLRGLK